MHKPDIRNIHDVECLEDVQHHGPILATESPEPLEAFSSSDRDKSSSMWRINLQQEFALTRVIDTCCEFNTSSLTHTTIFINMTFIIIFIWTLTAFAQECRGQITVTQSPSITAEQPGGTVNIKCKTSRDVRRLNNGDEASRGITVTQPEVVNVSEGQIATIDCKTDTGIDGYGLAWYQQKHGEAPKLIITGVNDLYDESFSRFSGDGARGGTDFSLTISGVQTEDAGHYYCMSVHEVNSDYVFTQ
ncbi:unnamed protein product [Leuciscus chuanchicus]